MLRFAYRLGFYFQKLDPIRDILFQISRRDIVRWMAFLQLEPPEADRADQRSAVQAAFLGDRFALATEPTDPNHLILDWRKLTEPKKTAPANSDEARIAEAEALILQINTKFRH